MARDGSGTYNLPAGQPVSTGTVISSTTHNTLATDLGSAMTQSIAKDGQTTPTANLPMGGFKHTGVLDGNARNNYASLGQVQDHAVLAVASVSGTNTITGSLSPALTAYSTGMLVTLVPANTNTGAVTIALNGLTAKAIVKSDNSALTGSELKVGVGALIYYNGTSFQLLNPVSAIVIPAPSNGVALTVTGLANSSAVGITSPNTASQSFGLTLQAGTNSSDYALSVANASAAEMFKIKGAGNVTISAPSSGIALTLSGVSGSDTVQITSNSTGNGVLVLSGAAGTRALLGVGRTAREAYYGVSASAGGIITGDVAGDLSISTTTGNMLFSTSNGAGAAIKIAAGGGQTSIYEPLNSINALKNAATFETGSFTATLTGCTTSPTGTAFWTRVGNLVIVEYPSALTGTSNTTSCTVTGLPAAILPPRNFGGYASSVVDNGATLFGDFTLSTAGTLQLFLVQVSGSNLNLNSSGFTASGTKGLGSNTHYVCYNLT